LQTVFQEWIRHLRLCSESGGEYVEWTLQNYIFTFTITSTGDESPGQYRTPCSGGGLDYRGMPERTRGSERDWVSECCPERDSGWTLYFQSVPPMCSNCPCEQKYSKQMSSAHRSFKAVLPLVITCSHRAIHSR
jgi:hypothetical protein